jgi:hypothetical protein
VAEEEEPFPGMEEAGTEGAGAPEDMPIDDETPEDEVVLSDEEDEEIPGEEEPSGGEASFGEEVLPDEEMPPDEKTLPGEEASPDEEVLPDEEPFSDDAVLPEGEIFPGGAPDEENPFGEETPENFGDQDLAGEDEALSPGDLPEESGEEFPGTPAFGDAPPAEEPAEEPVPGEDVSGEAVPGVSTETSTDEAPPVSGENFLPETAEEPEKPGENVRESLLGLMKFLKSLTGSLPEGDRDIFMQSDARLGMEYIIDTLEGRKGLIRDIEERVPAGRIAAKAAALSPESGAALEGVSAAASPAEGAAPEGGIPAAGQAAPGEAGGRMARLRAEAEEQDRRNPRKKKRETDVAGMLAFLARLAGALPDPHLGRAIGRRAAGVISGLRKTGKKGGNE